MAAPVQRRAIEGERQYFTLRQTRRTVPMTFSMMFVQARDRRSSAGRPSRVTVRDEVIWGGPAEEFEEVGASPDRTLQ